MTTWRDELASAIAAAPAEDLPEVLGELERHAAVLWIRLHMSVSSPGPDERHILLGVDQVAARLNVSRRYVYDHADELGVVKLSRRKVRFAEQAVEKFLRRHLRQA